jgi:hypothetical protein
MQPLISLIINNTGFIPGVRKSNEGSLMMDVPFGSNSQFQLVSLLEPEKERSLN